jgi:hypothetical protein
MSRAHIALPRSAEQKFAKPLRQAASFDMIERTDLCESRAVCCLDEAEFANDWQGAFVRIPAEMPPQARGGYANAQRDRL